MITIFIVDDQSSTRAVLRLRLELEADLTVIGDAANDLDTVAQVNALNPNVVVMDMSMPLLHGSATHALLLQLASSVPVIVLSLYDDATTREHILASGAYAIVSMHGADELVLAAIRDAEAHYRRGQ